LILEYNNKNATNKITFQFMTDKSDDKLEDTTDPDTLECAFCGKTGSEVVVLVKSETGKCICDQCAARFGKTNNSK